jgi:hypothetical protein
MFYPENCIVIIDDNSDPKFLTTESLYKTTILNSEFPKRGELLPYYYYLKHKLFDTAVILHDSVFIQKYIKFNVEKYKFLWYFDSKVCPQIEDETKMINLFQNSDLLKFYQNRTKWLGCFGGMTCITHDYLSFINSKYPLEKLLDSITSRYNRCSFERVLAVLLQKHHTESSFFGCIFKYCKWGITIDQTDKYKDLPLLKVWTGR